MTAGKTLGRLMARGGGSPAVEPGPAAFRYEVTARGKRLWMGDLATVADMESRIWRTFWDPAWSMTGSNTGNAYWRSGMSLNVQSIRQRLQRLELYIGELEKQRQAILQTFQSDFTRQLAAERAF